MAGAESADLLATEQLATGHGTVMLLRVAAATTEILLPATDHYRLDIKITARANGLKGRFSGLWPDYRWDQVGDLFLQPPQQPLQLAVSEPVSDAHPYDSLVAQLPTALVDQWAEAPLQWQEGMFANCLDLADRSLQTLMLRLVREMMYPRHASAALIELGLQELTIELGRLFNNAALTPLQGGLASWRLRLIDERIQALGPSPSLHELAGLCKISVRQLSRGFQVSRGFSLGHYVEKQRFEAAKRFLKEGVAITEVSTRLGYRQPANFAQAFRRQVGMPPSRFRQVIVGPPRGLGF